MADKKDEKKKPRTFAIRTGRFDQNGTFTPTPSFSGTRHGLVFREGVCATEDAIKAHACLEYGYEVLDETGKPAFEVVDAKTGKEE